MSWSEASLKALYNAVRKYMDIKPRALVLNEKLGVANDFVSFFFFFNKKKVIPDI